jgi:hypothetical protein
MLGQKRGQQFESAPPRIAVNVNITTDATTGATALLLAVSWCPFAVKFIDPYLWGTPD